MIISNKAEKFDYSTRFITYEANKKGKCVPKSDLPEFAGKNKLADALYSTRLKKIKEYKNEVLSGEISPIEMFIKLDNMSVADIAARLRISASKVKKHLTLNGFKKINIETLQKYAKIFDVSVVDFFQFINVNEDISFNINNHQDRLIQNIDVSGKKQKGKK